MNQTLSQLDPQQRRTNVRWLICGLLFFCITINYIDRQIISVLKPTLEKQFGWGQTDYGNIVFAFQCAYAVGLLGVGAIIDRIGVKLGLFIAVLIWSLAAAAHGFASWVPAAHAIMFFTVVRVLLGLGEAGAFPSTIRATAEWFPKKERSLATGIFNSGSNIGAICTPLLVPIIVRWKGWPEAFFITGGLGVIWLILWATLYRRPEDHRGVSPAELEHIRSDPPDPVEKIPWSMLMTQRPAIAFAAGKFLTDPIWWMYLFWVPDFLNKRHGLNLKDFGPPLVIIYLMADVGSIGGGWLSSRLIKSGRDVASARRLTMLICALLVVPIIAVTWVSNVWVATLIIGLAAAAHQGWSANIFTLVSDAFPRRAVASVVGFGGMAGAIGGMVIAWVVSRILAVTNNSYFIPFLIAGSAYLVALAVMQLLNRPQRADTGFDLLPPNG